MTIKFPTVLAPQFPMPPTPRPKPVRVLGDGILDFGVACRVGSATNGWRTAETLTRSNGEQLFVPRGLAHDFCTPKANAEVAYEADSYFAREFERDPTWDDAALGIEWLVSSADAILSHRDRNPACLADFACLLSYDGFGCPGDF